MLIQQREHEKGRKNLIQANQHTPELLSEVIAQVPFLFRASPVSIADIPEEQIPFPAKEAWRFSLSLEGREMHGYWFGRARTPAAPLIICNLLLSCYSTRAIDRITDDFGGYGKALLYVLGHELLKRLLSAD